MHVVVNNREQKWQSWWPYLATYPASSTVICRTLLIMENEWHRWKDINIHSDCPLDWSMTLILNLWNLQIVYTVVLIFFNFTELRWKTTSLDLCMDYPWNSTPRKLYTQPSCKPKPLMCPWTRTLPVFFVLSVFCPMTYFVSYIYIRPCNLQLSLLKIV
jgi:hypothetical protein